MKWMLALMLPVLVCCTGNNPATSSNQQGFAAGVIKQQTVYLLTGDSAFDTTINSFVPESLLIHAYYFDAAGEYLRDTMLAHAEAPIYDYVDSIMGTNLRCSQQATIDTHTQTMSEMATKVIGAPARLDSARIYYAIMNISTVSPDSAVDEMYLRIDSAVGDSAMRAFYADSIGGWYLGAFSRRAYAWCRLASEVQYYGNGRDTLRHVWRYDDHGNVIFDSSQSIYSIRNTYW